MTAVQKLKAIKSIILSKEMSTEERSEHIGRAAHLTGTLMCAKWQLEMARIQLRVHSIDDGLIEGIEENIRFLRELPYEAF